MRECLSINLPPQIACWWEETTITTHLRLAAGICVLTSGLLIGSAGGAIAAADDESTGSGSTTTQSQATQDPGQSVSPASAPTAAPTATPPTSKRPTLRDIIRKLQLLGKPRQRTVVVESTTDPVTTGTETAKHDADVAAGTSDTVASDSNIVATDSNVTTPATKVAASDSDVPAPSVNPAPPPMVTVVAPVTDAVAKVAAVALSIPGLVMSLPASKTPVADVITLVQEMLTAVGDVVVALAQVPSDFYSLFGVVAANPTVMYAGGDGTAGVAAAARSALPPPMSPVPAQVPPISGIEGLPGFGNITAPAVLGGIAATGLSQDLSLSGTAPMVTEGVGPTSALSFLEHTVRAVLAPASLTALAAIALPGIGGLLIICAAGMRVGYRQAKAVLAVRSTGIARFIRQGPLGVVRSGSLVALRPRALRVVRPAASRAAHHLEQVA